MPLHGESLVDIMSMGVVAIEGLLSIQIHRHFKAGADNEIQDAHASEAQNTSASFEHVEQLHQRIVLYPRTLVEQRTQWGNAPGYCGNLGLRPYVLPKRRVG